MVAVAESTLKVGDHAPKLQTGKWVQGDPVNEFEKGKAYIVEFWATWCGPCRQSIPHLNETYTKFKDKDLIVIGQDCWEQDDKLVAPFVKKMGEKMTYRVALDEKTENEKGKMAETWMEAAGRNGIPSAFLVDTKGTVAWIGHPMGLDQPLEKLAAGTWDAAAAKAQFQKDQAQRRKMSELQAKLTTAQQSGDPHQMLTALDQAIAENPGMEATLGIGKYQVLARGIKDPEKARAYGSHLVDSVLKDNAAALNQFAWMIVAPEAPKADAGAVKLALKAAQRADGLAQGKDPGIADTLAKAYFDAGSLAKALQTQQRAVRLAKGTPVENDPGVRARLEQYRKAVKPH